MTLPTIEAAQSGSKQAQASLAKRIRAIAYRTALGILRDEHEAKDIAHDCVIKILTQLHRYNPTWKFSTWVTVITRNSCIDWLRKQKRRSWSEVPDVSCENPNALQLIARKERKEAVQMAVQDLPEIYREATELYHFEDMKYREIAAHLDLPIGTVMNRIFRARKKLKSSLDPYWALQPAA